VPLALQSTEVLQSQARRADRYAAPGRSNGLFGRACQRSHLKGFAVSKLIEAILVYRFPGWLLVCALLAVMVAVKLFFS
jgi:hypothetical protein